MNAFRYEKDAHGIVTITMDMTGPVNSMNEEYRLAMPAAVDVLEKEPGLKGVVIASAKKVFFAGGNLRELLDTTADEVGEFMASVEAVKKDFRRLEKLPVPVVAAINGAALGGGFEICLACNHRIAWDDRSVLIGLPEVGLGLLPGGGGVVRMVKLLGLEKALPYLLEGRKLAPAQAQKAGLIHETVAKAEDLVPRAKAWILQQAGNPLASVQPWDTQGFQIPGGGVSSPHVAQTIEAAPASIRRQTRGLLPAPEQILDCAVEALRLDFDSALRVETRGLAALVITPEAKNLITTLFFGMNRINGGGSRPKIGNRYQVAKLGVLGAGMMGRGIAYVSAAAGIDVVLKDVSLEVAEKGKNYSKALVEKRVGKGEIDEAAGRAILDRIKATDDDADLQGCDLVVEAVLEEVALKRALVQKTEHLLASGGIWGTNTSSLPITLLAQGSARPSNFIGIHFFSPVERMPLVEIICGRETSEETLAKAFDYARQIKKTPIVVNDSLSFFTSRTFGTYLDEGIRLLVEGVHPQQIDNLGKAVGMPVGPLQVHDETSLELTKKCFDTWESMGELNKWYDQSITRQVVERLIGEYGRAGRHRGGGFYDYPEGGERQVWPKLVELYHNPAHAIPEADIKDRLLFRQVIESLRCLESGVLRSVEDGNVGSILGIGAPTHTGGFIQFVNTYGLERFAARCGELANTYGMRFEPPKIVGEKIVARATFV